MMLLLFFAAFAVSIFLFVFFAGSEIKAKRQSSAKKSVKSFKELPLKRKRIIISLAVFFVTAIALQNIVFAIIAAGLYLYFDWYFKDKKAKKLAAMIDKQVIEALTVIKNAVQAGQSLQNAIDTACDELKEPIKAEFVKMSETLALGVSFDKVLDEASQNPPSKEFGLMIDTIKISKDTGASLAGIFDRIIDATSQRVAIQSKVDALTAQGRMSGNVVSVIPFFVILMMYSIEPDMMRSLFTTLAGNILLLVVVVMVLSGSFVIRKLTEIDF